MIFTSLSGSGKSSLAFDTSDAKEQGRYVESLSAFARRKLGKLSRSKVEHASGISATIFIEPKTAEITPLFISGLSVCIEDH